MTERLSAPGVALCALFTTLLLSACGGGTGAGFDEVRALPASPAERLVYGEEADQFGLFWRAPREAAGETPLVVLLHGGCWLADYSVDHVRPLASALAAAGFHVWAPEYRRLDDSGRDHRAILDDIASALSYVERLPVVVSAMAVVGHSAGGHLALLAASRDAAPPASLRLAVGLAPITDLVSYGAVAGSCPRAVDPFVGAGPDAGMRSASLSPATRAFDVPIISLHGSRDGIVPLAQSGALGWRRVELVPGAGHFDLIDPRGDAFVRLLRRLRAGFAA